MLPLECPDAVTDALAELISEAAPKGRKSGRTRS
jgi:hypothetical protein